MNGPQHLAKGLALRDDARTAEAGDEDAERVLALYLDAVVELLAALTLATVHGHMSKDVHGNWNEVAA